MDSNDKPYEIRKVNYDVEYEIRKVNYDVEKEMIHVEIFNLDDNLIYEVNMYACNVMNLYGLLNKKN